MSAIDIEAPDSVEQIVRQSLPTTHVRVTGQLFDFELEVAVFEVSYGIMDPQQGFLVKRQELWNASGPPLASLMTEAPVGATRLAVLRDLARDAVNTIQTTPGLKANLIANGHLVITPGSLRANITPGSGA